LWKSSKGIVDFSDPTKKLLFFEKKKVEKKKMMISDSGHEVDALGHAGEEGRKGHERVR